MFNPNLLLDPISNLFRAIREVSKPSADRMRRKARRLEKGANRDMIRYSLTNSTRRSQKYLARALRKNREALQLRKDAHRMDGDDTQGNR